MRLGTEYTVAHKNKIWNTKRSTNLHTHFDNIKLTVVNEKIIVELC